MIGESFNKWEDMKWFFLGLILSITYAHSSPGKFIDFKERKKEFILGPLKIDKIYKSMAGPEKSLKDLDFELNPKKSKNIWITKFKAEVLDTKDNNESQEFMCHVVLRSTAETISNATLGVAQGQKEVIFPKGFAVRMVNHPNYPIVLDGQILNNNYRQINKDVYFKITVSYVDDEAAKKLELKPMEMKFFGGLCPNKTCEPVYPEKTYHVCEGKKYSGHWLVPPGKHNYPAVQNGQLALTKNIKIHYIWMHLHPYGESISLKDLTTGKIIWTGKAKNQNNKAVVLETDHFSSPEGIWLYKDHQYEVTTSYNNKTGKKIDAMGLLYMYYNDPNYSF